LSRVEDPENSPARVAGANQPPSSFDSPPETKAQGSPVHESSAHESSVHELLQSTRDALARESGPTKVLFGVSIRTIAAVAVSAVVALLLVILIPGLRRSDPVSSFSADVQQFMAAPSSQSQDRQSQDRPNQDRPQQDQPLSKEAAKPTTEQFQRVFASPGEPAAQPDRAPSDKLLQRFMQWRLKNGSAENAQ
jgi:hypothetical protein